MGINAFCDLFRLLYKHYVGITVINITSFHVNIQEFFGGSEARYKYICMFGC